MAEVARLATVRSDGSPHLVPITFALSENRIYTMIDHKPKTTINPQRLDNIRANPRVSVLVDQYDSSWADLWWVRVDGSAKIVDRGGMHEIAAAKLTEKYEQYRDHPPAGPAIVISIDNVRSWRWSR